MEALANQPYPSHSVTMAANALTAVMLFIPSISPVYRAMTAISGIAIFNIMSCRVYRKVKLGAITNEITGVVSASGIGLPEPSSVQLVPMTLISRGEDFVPPTEGEAEAVSLSSTLFGVV